MTLAAATLAAAMAVDVTETIPAAWWQLAVLAAVTAVASAVNAIAGGGTILTFPVLSAILPDTPGRLVVANATSTIGLLPGAVVASWEYREDRRDLPSWSRWLVVPSAAGAMVGSVLVLALPSAWFDAIVPWLILLAAVLFTVQPQLSAWTAARGGSRSAQQSEARGQDNAAVSLRTAAGLRQAPQLPVAMVLQFLVALYGGYFGAGIGILMLAMLGGLGLGDIHRLNAVKNVLGGIVNGAAALLFATGAVIGWHDVAWEHAGVMAAAAALGGSLGTRLTRRLPSRIVRRMVAVIGFLLAGYYFLN